MWLPSYAVFDTLYADKPGVGHYFALPSALTLSTPSARGRARHRGRAALFEHFSVCCIQRLHLNFAPPPIAIVCPFRAGLVSSRGRQLSWIPTKDISVPSECEFEKCWAYDPQARHLRRVPPSKRYGAQT